MDSQQAVGAALGIAIAARVPVLLWGAPGTGKTSVITAMAAAAGWPCETVIASIREPSDFAGLPVVHRGTAPGPGDPAPGHGAASASVEFAPPRWAVTLAAAGHGLVFFDEISTAPPAVQAALLRVVLERTVGDLTLPASVSVVAAANPPEQAADGWDLSAPLANRFCHLDWPVDPRTVAAGFSAGWPVPGLPDLPDGWEDRVPVTRSWIAGFFTVRPPLVLAPPEDPAAAGRAWPSPRTWDLAARLHAAALAAGASDLIVSLLIRGCVGPGPGAEFWTWLAEADLPDPEAVLADPESFVLPERGDRAYAALSSVAAAVAANPAGGRWARGWQVFGRAAGAAPDVAAAAARTLAGCRPPGAPIPPEVSLFAPLLRDAGLLR
ncbi:MAG: MoxR family ATPase [Actinomycetota bacterium]|nr:MoxR family ATPase [Actinomycetota bacterium]